MVFINLIVGLISLLSALIKLISDTINLRSAAQSSQAQASLFPTIPQPPQNSFTRLLSYFNNAKLRRLAIFLVLAVSGLVLIDNSFINYSTYDLIKNYQGFISCGIDGNLDFLGKVKGQEINGGYSKADGFNAKICQIIAYSIFGDENKVRYFKITNLSEGLEKIKIRSSLWSFLFYQNRSIDLLLKNVTDTFSRRLEHSDVKFGPTLYWDGQGFAVIDSIKATSDLKTAKICVRPGTTTVENIIKTGINGSNLPYVGTKQPGDLYKTSDPTKLPSDVTGFVYLKDMFDNKECEVVSSDVSQLISYIKTNRPDRNFRILLSKNFKIGECSLTPENIKNKTCSPDPDDSSKGKCTPDATNKSICKPISVPYRVSREPIVAVHRSNDPKWDTYITVIIDSLIKADQVGLGRLEKGGLSPINDKRTESFVNDFGREMRDSGFNYEVSNSIFSDIIQKFGNYSQIYNDKEAFRSIEEMNQSIWYNGVPGFSIVDQYIPQKLMDSPPFTYK
jgi:ABC-type amino acid transport substrate-binding protein